MLLLRRRSATAAIPGAEGAWALVRGTRAVNPLGPLYAVLEQSIRLGRSKLVGVSAGSIVPSKTLSTANDPDQQGRPGLGILPFHMHPHWLGATLLDNDRREMAVWQYAAVISLDSDAWVIIDQGKVTVYGDVRANGLRWRRVTRRPQGGTELTAELAGGLLRAITERSAEGREGKVVFTQEEWEELSPRRNRAGEAHVSDIMPLQTNHFVSVRQPQGGAEAEVGEFWYVPVKANALATLATRESQTTLFKGDQITYRHRQDGRCSWNIQHHDELQTDGILLQDSMLYPRILTPRHLQMLLLSDSVRNRTLRFNLKDNDAFDTAAKVALQAYLKSGRHYRGAIVGDLVEPSIEQLRLLEAQVRGRAEAALLGPALRMNPAELSAWYRSQHGVLVLRVYKEGVAPLGTPEATKALQKLVGAVVSGIFGEQCGARTDCSQQPFCLPVCGIPQMRPRYARCSVGCARKWTLRATLLSVQTMGRGQGRQKKR